MNDLRFAFRQLLKNPGFTAVAVLILALGIGAYTSIFSVVNLLLFRPLPYPEADRLVRVFRTSPFSQTEGHSLGAFLDHRAQNQTFERLAACNWEGFNFGSSGQTAQRISALLVTTDFFPM